MDLGLRDRVCVVTGSTGGIGLGRPRGCSPPRARASSPAVDGEAPGVGEALHVGADLVAARASRSVSVAEAGELDVLVNNVGYA